MRHSENHSVTNIMESSPLAPDPAPHPPCTHRTGSERVKLTHKVLVKKNKPEHPHTETSLYSLTCKCIIKVVCKVNKFKSEWAQKLMTLSN